MKPLKHLIFTFALLTSQISVFAATEINPGVLYAGGTRLTVSGLGIEFSVPGGWQALLPEGSEAMIMEPVTAMARIIVTAVANSNEKAIHQRLSESQPLDAGSTLVPAGKVAETVSRNSKLYFQTFNVQGSNPQNLAASAYARLGNNQTALYAVLLEAKAKSKYKSINHHLVSSASFIPLSQSSNSRQDIVNWEQQLKGGSLKYLHTSDGLSVEKQIYLCSNTTFNYARNSDYISSDATVDYSSASQGGDSGNWKIKGNEITLTWADGSTTTSTLERRYAEGESGIYVDGQQWFATNNDVCN